MVLKTKKRKAITKSFEEGVHFRESCIWSICVWILFWKPGILSTSLVINIVWELIKVIDYSRVDYKKLSLVSKINS